MSTIVTPALISALQVGFKKHFEDGYSSMSVQSAYEKIATLVPSNSVSETYGWLGEFPEMREWVGDRVIKGMEAYGYSITNKSFESTVGVKETDIDDDRLGIYVPRFKRLGEAAAKHPDKLVFSLLARGREETCFDGQYFFDTDHPSFDASGAAATASNVDTSGQASAPFWYLLDTSGALKPMIFQERKKPRFIARTDPRTSEPAFMRGQYVYGVDSRCNVGFGFWQMAYASNAALNGDSLDAAIAHMRELRDSNGSPLGIEPNLLVVPPCLRADANKTVKVMFGEGGASNANYQAVDVLDTPWVA